MVADDVPEGSVRLWRMDPADGGLAPVSSWISETEAYRNMVAARGRWFTDDREEAEWYAEEHPGGRLVFVDLPEAVAESYRVSGMPLRSKDEKDSPRAWSARSWKEFFLPAALAAMAMPVSRDDGPTVTFS